MSVFSCGRVVTIPCGNWSSTKAYECLSLVYNSTSGNSYIAKQAVPKGTALTDTDYWVLSSEYSAQYAGLVDDIELLRAQVAANVTASTDDDADYAAEVVDARVDSEGNTSASLGEAVREIDAELVDARTDDEGAIYGSAGEAIRERIGTLDETLFDTADATYNNAGITASSSHYFGLAFTEDVYLKTLTPQFSSDSGTFTWWVVTTEKDILADSSTSEKSAVTVTGEKHSASIGDTIEVNQKITTKMAVFIIPDDSDTMIMFTSQINSVELKAAHLCYIGGGTNYSSAYGTGTNTWYYSGDFVLYEKTERYVKTEELEPYAKTEDVDQELAYYAKKDDLDDYVQREEIYEIGEEETAYDVDGANNSMSDSYYGFNPKEAVYIKTFTPRFSGTDGTFTWAIGTTTDDVIALGSVLTLTDWTEQDIGTAIELEQTLKPNQTLIIHGNSDSILTYASASNSYFYCTNGKSSVSQLLTVSLSAYAELVLPTETPIYATKEELESAVEDTDEKLVEYAKTDDLEDYVKRTEVFETNTWEETLEFAAKSNTTANCYYGINPQSDIYIKTFTPAFSGSTGTFTWGVATSTDGEPIAQGSKMTMGEWTEQEVGTAIEFNDTLLTTQSLIIHGNDDSILMYYNVSNDYFKITGTSATSAGQYLNGCLAGEMEVQFSEEVSVFASQNDMDEVKETLDSAESNPNPLYGKKLVGIGDSMMQGHSISKANGWLAKIADRNGMTYVNYGINGTYMTNKTYGTNEYAGVVDRYSEMDDDADYILIFAGTNDISASVTIGEEDSEDESEFYGALNSICQGLMSKYPNGKIGFITPHVRSKSARTKTLTYIEAIETACQNNGGIPVFNNAKNGGLCYWNSEQAAALTLGDGCHYSADGMEWFSWKYEAFLRSL